MSAAGFSTATPHCPDSFVGAGHTKEAMADVPVPSMDGRTPPESHLGVLGKKPQVPLHDAGPIKGVFSGGYKAAADSAPPTAEVMGPSGLSRSQADKLKAFTFLWESLPSRPDYQAALLSLGAAPSSNASASGSPRCSRRPSPPRERAPLTAACTAGVPDQFAADRARTAQELQGWQEHCATLQDSAHKQQREHAALLQQVQGEFKAMRSERGDIRELLSSQARGTFAGRTPSHHS